MSFAMTLWFCRIAAGTAPLPFQTTQVHRFRADFRTPATKIADITAHLGHYPGQRFDACKRFDFAPEIPEAGYKL